jgi:hypothetical protein
MKDKILQIKYANLFKKLHNSQIILMIKVNLFINN